MKSGELGRALVALAWFWAWSIPAQPSTLRLPSLIQITEPQSRVIVVEDARATTLFKPAADRVEAMVQRGLTNLTGHIALSNAWSSLVVTGETIGIKVFTGPGPSLGTRLPVVEALVKGLLASGHPTNGIIVWDKHRGDLLASGYGILSQRYGVRVEGAANAGYDDDVFYENPLLGNLVYGDHEFGLTGEGIGRKSFISKLVTREMDKIILVSPLLNHNRAGVCGNLYSLALGSADNVIRFDVDPGRLAMAVPEMCALPELGDRVILCVVDALICQYQGQERELLHYAAVLNEIRFSRDPVALDVLSLQELKRQRELAGIEGGFLNMDLYRNASLLQIGISNPAQILVERLP